MEDLVSTTRYVTWSLHNKNQAGLRQFLDSFAGSEQSTSFNSTHASLSQELSSGSVLNDNRSDKPKSDVKLSHVTSSNDASTSETRLVDLLDNTLWNRKLAPSSERIVYALVQQIFHGIREYFLASAELKFYDLLNIFELNGLPSGDNPYLFNGDFVDRGSFSLEVILTLFAFKCMAPSDLLVRSHEVNDEGYEIMHSGKLITVFSAPNYCDQMGNKGAFIKFQASDMKPNIVTFTAVVFR